MSARSTFDTGRTGLDRFADGFIRREEIQRRVRETTLLRGRPLADDVLDDVQTDLGTLRAHGVRPTLGTVLMSDDDAAVSFMDRKHERCDAVGVRTKRADLSPDDSAAALYDAVERLATDDEVNALFVQVPLPDHVDAGAVRARVPPAKDIDCFAPATLGRLVAGDPLVVPPTPAAVLKLLSAYDVETAGRDVVVVGRTTAICKPLANLLLARGPDGDATVTVCHTATRDLAAKTRTADILVTAAGTPRLVDASMVSPGVSVVDVSVNRVPADTERGYELVGDVDYERVESVAGAITPVPGGVGPLTLAFVLRNVVDVTARQTGVDVVDGP
ncbi:bifunctional 5,10-methylenetetrahydrofolate dehydrogenase/5,10-methenyltetrahydrofolate cyclohydrolase [Haloarcula pellucida]|uniref:bifunctional 5,10-methylenetetrahydrofolate dehydrogenase/5,10-methenyltetrahydrofolate cyclohydrolase n=1 Tax=Haloarcula pellucida TaxID=1427151 RepID=UPI001E397FF2|nr:tetrahydrofolate dehydrogenase/cyclohydrolase catalytic domain-containing protein [Halomicroarcula pellucida]